MPSTEKDREGERKNPQTTGPQEDTPAQAEAGLGPRPEPVQLHFETPSELKRRRRRTKVDPLSPELRQLAKDVGADKIAPPRTAVENYQQRSYDIRDFVLNFLNEQDGHTWPNVRTLAGAAALEAGCSIQAADSWIFQFTIPVPRAPFRLRRGLGYIIVERKENGR